MAPASSKEFLDIQATVECGFTLKIRTSHDKNIQTDCNTNVTSIENQIAGVT